MVLTYGRADEKTATTVVVASTTDAQYLGLLYHGSLFLTGLVLFPPPPTIKGMQSLAHGVVDSGQASVYFSINPRL